MRTRSGSWQAATILTAAATALVSAGADQRWTPLWREVVHRLRRHPAADVHSAALDLAMAGSGLS